MASTWLDGYHTTGPRIHNLGGLAPDWQNPRRGEHVEKAGRTSGYTAGVVKSTDATVQVSYGTFTAEFEDQAIIAGDPAPFSLPGDSGSLVVHAQTHEPTALLFAGNDQLTVASPIGPIVDDFDLLFPPLP